MCNMTITLWSPQVCCLVSGAKSSDQYDDDNEDEDGQTNGDPKLLLHWNKQSVHLAHKSAVRPFGKIEKKTFQIWVRQEIKVKPCHTLRALVL